MTESVEWERLADHEEAPRSAAGAVAPMSDERLAEIQQLAARSRAFVARHLTAALRELLAEVDRLRDNSEADWRGLTTALEGWNEETGNAWRSYAEQLARAAKAERELRKCAALNLNLVNENAEATVRTETAERELAEVREQHQPGPSLHAWRRPDGRDVHGEQGWIRKSVKAHGGAHVTAETCSYVGEWKAADGG